MVAGAAHWLGVRGRLRTGHRFFLPTRRDRQKGASCTTFESVFEVEVHRARPTSLRFAAAAGPVTTRRPGTPWRSSGASRPTRCARWSRSGRAARRSRCADAPSAVDRSREGAGRSDDARTPLEFTSVAVVVIIVIAVTRVRLVPAKKGSCRMRLRFLDLLCEAIGSHPFHAFGRRWRARVVNGYAVTTHNYRVPGQR